MGVDRLRCVSFAGEGYAGMVGQNMTQDTDWPRGEPLQDYSRVIDYERGHFGRALLPQARPQPRFVEIRPWLEGRDAAATARTPDLRGQRRKRLARRRGSEGGGGPGKRRTLAARHLDDPARLRQGGADAWRRAHRDLALGTRRERAGRSHDRRDCQGNGRLGDRAGQVPRQRQRCGPETSSNGPKRGCRTRCWEI